MSSPHSNDTEGGDSPLQSVSDFKMHESAGHRVKMQTVTQWVQEVLRWCIACSLPGEAAAAAGPGPLVEQQSVDRPHPPTISLRLCFRASPVFQVCL